MCRTKIDLRLKCLRKMSVRINSIEAIDVCGLQEHAYGIRGEVHTWTLVESAMWCHA